MSSPNQTAVSDTASNDCARDTAEIHKAIQETGASSSRDQLYPISLMIIMALSCNSGREMAKKDFVDWILANFHFLRSLASNQFVEPTSSGRTATSEKFRQEFHWALQTVHQDLPITVRQPYILGTKMYSISRTTGRRYLIHADILREEHQQGVFRFFDLPPELRSQVHRLIFEYDRPLHFEHTSRGPSNAAHFLQRHSDGSHIVLSKHKHILLG